MRRCRPWLGTFVEIEAGCARAIEAAFAAVERVHRLMSSHDCRSELSILNRSAGASAVRLSEDTRIVIERALFWARASDGAFDPVAAGRAAVARGALPVHDGQRLPEPSSNFRALSLDGDWAGLARPACVDLGGIAKGHAVDAAIAALRAAGMKHGLVNAGGDVSAFGRQRRFAVPDPSTGAPRLSLILRDRALATSAGLRGEGGLDFAHLPCRYPTFESVTVEAARAIDADALTKIAFAGHARLPQILAMTGSRALAITSSGAVVDLAEDRLAA